MGGDEVATTKAGQVLVVGGGIAGLTAASALAAQGIRVDLVERAAHLGGHAGDWACMATDQCARCSACAVEDEIHRVRSHPLVEIHRGAQIESVSGRPGDFRVTIVPSQVQAEPRGSSAALLDAPRELTAAAVVLATGFQPYDPSPDPLLGYGHHPGVLTLEDVDRALKRDELDTLLPPDGPRRMAFIQCVGSRDRTTGRGYCSQFCCRASIRLLSRLLYLCPDLSATVFYIDLQIMSKEFSAFYRRVKDRVQFVQGVPAEISPGEKPEDLRVYGVRTGQTQAETFEFDRIVLATGLAPTEAHTDLAEAFGLELDTYGYLDPDQLSAGLFLAGACSGPTDIQGSRRQALAAASQVQVWLQACSSPTARRPEADAASPEVQIHGR